MKKTFIYRTPESRLATLFVISVLLSSCAGRLQTPKDGLANLSVGDNQSQGATASNAGPGEKFDPVADEYVSKESLKAWRHALAHDDQGMLSTKVWNEIRQKDEAESMEMLNSLAQRYPTVSYIKVMMGQVKQHFGKSEEAAKYYEESSLQNRRDPILMFKAAEARRKQGDIKRALLYYRQVQKLQADFPGAKRGEALCLLADKKTAKQGKELLQTVVAADPSDQAAREALEKAR